MGRLVWVLCVGLPLYAQLQPPTEVPPGIRYATTALNWAQTISQPLRAGAGATLTLTPCPIGVDTTSGVGYQVFLSGGGNSEAANVVSGTCASGAASGTITFTPYFSYPAGSKVGSASSGIQETINSACGVDPISFKNGQCNVIVPANGPQVGTAHSINTYNIPGTIYLHTNQSVLSGYGASLDCIGRGPCLQVGDLKNSNHFGNNTIQGFSFRSPIDYSGNSAYAGVAITAAQRASQVATITTATPHGFRPGDMVAILFTDDNRYWGDAIVQSVLSPTTFTYTHQGADIAAATTPGVIALAYEPVLDNGINTHFTDISYDLAGENGHFNNFFDFWDDENALIEHFNNNAISLNGNTNWTGSFVFSGGNPPNVRQQVAAVITLRDSTITANTSNGITVYNSNGVYVENTVLQATGPWQVYASNTTGNYQGAALRNIYSESGTSANPVAPARSPFAGTGAAGLIAGVTSGAGQFSVSGSGGVQGFFPGGGKGNVLYSYFIVAKDVTAGAQTSPMQVLNYKSTGSDSITVRWPRVANQTDKITYDIIRAPSAGTIGATYPAAGNCNGGSTTACGSVAMNLTQCSGLVCSYTDNGAAVTQPYKFLPTSGTYGGNLIFWPGSIVTVNKSVVVDVEHQNVVGVGLAHGPLQVASRCLGYGQASAGGYTTCASSVTTPNNSVPNQTATLMTDGPAVGGGQTVSKGRLNFSTSPWAALQPHHIITLVDSQPALTRATIGFRPPASANDVWIGTDVSPGGVYLPDAQLAFGAPVAISSYIAGIGDGKTQNWLERLTAKQKIFAVPVTIKQGSTLTLGEGSPLSQMKVYRIEHVGGSRVPPQSCIDIAAKAAGLTSSDQITSVTPPDRLGNLSLNAYASPDSVTLHFCNASTAAAAVPAGAYSFLAVR